MHKTSIALIQILIFKICNTLRHMPRPFLKTLYPSKEITFIGFVSTSAYKGCNCYLKITILHSKFDNSLRSVIIFEREITFFNMFMYFLILVNNSIDVTVDQSTYFEQKLRKKFF